MMNYQNVEIDPNTIRPLKYMATRYLQLQHSNKQGKPLVMAEAFGMVSLSTTAQLGIFQVAAQASHAFHQALSKQKTIENRWYSIWLWLWTCGNG